MPPNITIPLSHYISILLRDDDYITLPFNHALELSQLDKEELYIHIQFESHEMEEWLEVFKNNRLDQPRVWRKQAWLNSQQHWVNQKAKSEERRRLYWREQENIEIVMHRLSRKMGIPPYLTHDLAVKLVTKKQRKALDALEVGEDIEL